MPFGLRNAEQSFQRFMDEVLAGLDFAFAWTISSSAAPVQRSIGDHLHLVLQRLQEHWLVLNMEKCELARQEIDFLGHRPPHHRRGCVTNPEACAGDSGFFSTSRQEAAAEFPGPS